MDFVFRNGEEIIFANKIERQQSGKHKTGGQRHVWGSDIFWVFVVILDDTEYETG